MAASGVRSSCETAATNSICRRASRSARSAVTASTATLPNIEQEHAEAESEIAGTGGTHSRLERAGAMTRDQSPPSRQFVRSQRRTCGLRIAFGIRTPRRC